MLPVAASESVSAWVKNKIPSPAEKNSLFFIKGSEVPELWEEQCRS
jgi:hypothetical protein